MKISELFNQLETLHLHKDSPQDNYVGEIENRPEVENVEPESDDTADKKTMVAPLQQKLELLKKAVDVDSYYGNESLKSQQVQPINITLNVPAGQSDSNINLTLNGQSFDELDQIKKIAGIPVATIFDAGDDEPLDS